MGDDCEVRAKVAKVKKEEEEDNAVIKMECEVKQEKAEEEDTDDFDDSADDEDNKSGNKLPLIYLLLDSACDISKKDG